MVEVAIAAALLALIPVNVGVAREVDAIARIDPRIDLLVLLSRIVVVLAVAACMFGFFGVLAVVRLITGVSPLPQPFGAIILAVMALAMSGANLLVLSYLRRKRP